MIINFTVENFLSFKEPQTLSLVAEPPYDNNKDNLLDSPIEGIKLLKAVIIYGANASGKSNFITALAHLRSLVLESLKFTPDDNLWYPLSPQFALNSESRHSPSRYEINFFCNNIRYNYSISFYKDRVFNEHLSYFPKRYQKLIFDRFLDAQDQYIFNFGADLKPLRIFNDIAIKTAKNVLFLSKAVQENTHFLEPIYNWFAKGLSEEPEMIDLARMCCNDNSYKKNILDFIRSQDINIVDLSIDEKKIEPDFFDDDNIPEEIKKKLLDDIKDQFSYKISTYHKDNNDDLIEFPIKLESTGTLKLLKLSPSMMKDSIYESKAFYIDELGSALHPLLVKNFVSSFQKTNNQLIAATHDTHLIDSEYLRKDQIYFIEKNSEQASVLYSLSDFRPRNDRENWELRYLSGRYGATPFFKD